MCQDGPASDAFVQSNYSDKVSSQRVPDIVSKRPSQDSWDIITSLLHDMSGCRYPATYSIKPALPGPQALGSGEDAHGRAQAGWQSFYVNNANTMQLLSLDRADNPAPRISRQFLVPPGSAFLLGDCADSAAFRAVVRGAHEGDAQSRRFHFILLDPPWPNASARRKHAYRRPPSLRELARLIEGMDLDSQISSGGFVGIWITNKPAIRALVLEPGGIFDVLNVGLVEEWIWIKTTVSGDPVSDMDSAWRKPYEVLLLGKAPSSSLVAAEHAEHIVRRVIAGVPDLHSRKPCLKPLIESLLLKSSEYNALEIFARNLVAGWWSWGDEVLKFNWKGAFTAL